MKKVPLEKNIRRLQLLEKMEALIVKKNSFVPDSLIRENSIANIDKIGESAHKTFRKYSVKPIEPN